MKKLILLLLFMSSLAFSQVVYITAGDSIKYRPDERLGDRYLYFALYDSSNSITDTLVCESRMSGATVWDNLAVVDVDAIDTEITGDIIPGDGNVKWYKVNMEYPGMVRLRRTNVTSRTQRSTIEWMGGL